MTRKNKWKGKKGLKIGLVLAALLVPTWSQAAVTWTMVRPQDCTAAATPTSCCLGANAAVNTETCLRREVMGRLFWVRAQIYVSTSGAYVTGGDALATAQFNKLGFSNVLGGFCEPSSIGRRVVLNIVNTGGVGGTIKMQLFGDKTQAAYTQDNPPAEVRTAETIPANEAVTCWIYGR